MRFLMINFFGRDFLSSRIMTSGQWRKEEGFAIFAEKQTQRHEAEDRERNTNRIVWAETQFKRSFCFFCGNLWEILSKIFTFCYHYEG
jgi:hypothetical protein